MIRTLLLVFWREKYDGLRPNYSDPDRAGYRAHHRCGDSPQTFGPMLAYVYVYSPGMLTYHGELERFFPDPVQLEYVALVNLLGVELFVSGACQHCAGFALGLESL